MDKSKTYLERLTQETIRPILGALDLLKQELAETMNIPDSPWKILNKSYDELTEEELLALADIYHQEGESKPCLFCSWVARAELQRYRKNKQEGV